MVLDIVVLGVLVGFTIAGCFSGFSRRLCSLLFPVIGVLTALRFYGDIALRLNRVIHSWPVSTVTSFAFLLLASWLAVFLARRLLDKLVDWNRLRDLDLFLGGVFGLARGMALVWVTIALVLTVFPPSVRLFQESRASTQLLSIAERLAGRSPGRGRAVPEIQYAAGTVARSAEMVGRFSSPFGSARDN